MVYSLDLNIKYVNDTDRDTFLTALPVSSDSRVVSRLHETPRAVRTKEGVNVIIGSIRYKNLSDLTNIRASLKGLNGTWTRSTGSIKGHQCYNDEVSPSPCIEGDVFEDIK